MAADTGRVSFGIKTSQAGTTYDDPPGLARS